MPRAVNNEAEYKASSYTLIKPDWYLAEIHEVTELPNRATGEEAYKVTVRIDGGPFDGVDITDNFVGLYGKSRFKLHQIVSSQDEKFSSTYYDKENHKWIAYPTEEELEELRLYVKIENEPYQRTAPDPERPKQRVELFLPDGSADLALANRITEYASAAGEKPAFRPSKGMSVEEWTPRPGSLAATKRRTDPGAPTSAAVGTSASDEEPW